MVFAGFIVRHKLNLNLTNNEKSQEEYMLLKDNERYKTFDCQMQV